MRNHQTQGRKRKNRSRITFIYIVSFICIIALVWIFLPSRSSEIILPDMSMQTDATQIEPRMIKKKPIQKLNEAEGLFADKEQISLQKDIKKLSKTIIKALNEYDMETIALYVNKEKGLLFSPYVYVTEEAVKFEQAELTTLLEDDKTYIWGDYDGKGTPIELTPKHFFDEFMDIEQLLDPDDVFIDDPQDRGNTENNIHDVFPDETVVEFYDEGSEAYAGIDWSSINLVYAKDEEGIYTLVAIVRDVWTI